MTPPDPDEAARIEAWQREYRRLYDTDLRNYQRIDGIRPRTPADAPDLKDAKGNWVQCPSMTSTT